VSQRTPMSERILRAADRLFYGRGIRAVGVDAIAAAAGISKRSLYDTYPSKDALVEAYLQHRIQPIPASDQPPAARILDLFGQLQDWFASGEFRGCPFVNAVAELGEDCAAARRIAARYRAEKLRLVEDWLAEAGMRDPAGLALQIMMLADGAIAAMLVHGDPAVARTAADAARTLMRAAGLIVTDGPDIPHHGNIPHHADTHHADTHHTGTAAARAPA
jgi:AcrR family transcriptional regulator